DKTKRGAARHPVREVCAAGRERSRRPLHRCRCRAHAPRSAAVRQPVRVSGIRRTYVPDTPGAGAPRILHVRGREPKTRTEPDTTLPLTGRQSPTPPPATAPRAGRHGLPAGPVNRWAQAAPGAGYWSTALCLRPDRTTG